MLQKIYLVQWVNSTYMTLIKQTKDRLKKIFLGKNSVPKGLFELSQYFRYYGPINFTRKRSEEGGLIAVSTNFRFGSIITSGKDETELDKNIKDAILTSFEVPSSYVKEADVRNTTDEKSSYAFV